MTWNYRVRHQTVPADPVEGVEDVFDIVECYYNDSDEITAWSTEPASAQGTTLDELRADLTTMVTALDNPPVDIPFDGYDAHPIDEPDEWGDLASFHDAAATIPDPDGERRQPVTLTAEGWSHVRDALAIFLRSEAALAEYELAYGGSQLREAIAAIETQTT